MKDRIIKKLEDQIKTLTKSIEKGKIMLCDFFVIIALNVFVIIALTGTVWDGVRNLSPQKKVQEPSIEIT